mgnify:CR=1 FL=1
MNSSLDKSFDFFLKNQFSKFEDGEWGAIYENEVVSHGKNLKEVVDSVKKKNVVPLSKILLSKIKKTASYL